MLAYMRGPAQIDQQLETLRNVYIYGPSPLSTFKHELTELLVAPTRLDDIEVPELQASLEQCLKDSAAAAVIPGLSDMAGIVAYGVKH